eukprot:TRINITY_DN30190_c0_g1_i1.p1 TRINITY_DN30190_c0_g1~~TRINITY_DN30190_c0_g1_i1.p1  ORF type:complete len:1006 (+),score=162.55 TRINITY_DN30190_c0_g1_i1:110-3127(+)
MQTKAAMSGHHVFLEQLRGALTNTGIDSLHGECERDATAHTDLVRELLAVLTRASVADPAPFKLAVSDYPALCSDPGTFLLAVCGFEEQRCEDSSTFLLNQQGREAAAFALPVVSGYLDAFGLQVKERFPLPQSQPTGETSPSVDMDIAADNAGGYPAATRNGIPTGSSSETKVRTTQATRSTGENSLGLQVPKTAPGALGIKQMPPLPSISATVDEDAKLAAALAASFNEDSTSPNDMKDRPGSEVAISQLAELGIVFEHQPDGSDTCAMHSLNNIAQIERPQEKASAALSAAVSIGVALEAGKNVAPELLSACAGPFGLEDLQQAEAASREQQLQGSFLTPPTDMDSSVLRAHSCGSIGSSPSGRGTKSRTGMFDIEAVKIATRAKGYEVIDIEPSPSWKDAEAARYVQAARASVVAGKRVSQDQRWFLGFLVYERIPGRAMHYYAILRWTDLSGSETWVLLDSMDRGCNKPRNKIMTVDDVVKFYNSNAEWFKSWLVRWYPVVHRTTAVAALQCALVDGVRLACETRFDMGDDTVALDDDVVSRDRAEKTLDGHEVRWNVDVATRALLDSAPLVGRELQVLRLALGEDQARRELVEADWDLEKAVRSRAERVLRLCRASDSNTATVGSGGCEQQRCDSVFGGASGSAIAPLPAVLQGASATYLALRIADWDVRAAAQILQLTASGEVSVDSLAAAVPSLRHARAALQACKWDLDQARGVQRLQGVLRERQRRCDSEHAGKPSEQSPSSVSEAEAWQLLQGVSFDEQQAVHLLEVRRAFPSAPVSVCAEALQRGDRHVASACELLREFQGRVRDLVAKVAAPTTPAIEMARSVQGTPAAPLRPIGLCSLEEALSIANLALDASDWSPSVAFCTAESFASGVVQVRAALWDLEIAMRRKALSIVDGSVSRGSQQESADGQSERVATALSALDAMDEACEKKEPSIPSMVAALKSAGMDPGEASSGLWRAMVQFEVAVLDPKPSKEVASSSSTTWLGFPTLWRSR